MIGWLFETSVAVTVLMVLVLAARRPVAQMFGAGWAYALWALPALRLVLPPLHLLGEGMPSLLPARAAAPAQDVALAASAPAQASTAFAWEPLVLAVWLAGAAAIILWQGLSYMAFVRRLGIGSRIHASFAQDVGLIESSEVDGPLAIGLLDKWIVVPADFGTRYSQSEQRLALEHERVHHHREDIFWNMIALGVLALNWYNPIAYLAFRAFRTDQELSCDAAVAARASGEERRDYAVALIKSASRPGLIAACPLNQAGQLKHRLRMIKTHRRSHARAAGGLSAVAALLLTGISATESPGVARPQPAPDADPATLATPARPAATFKSADAAAVLPAPARPSGRSPASPAAVRPARAAVAAPAARVPQRSRSVASATSASIPPQPSAPVAPALATPPSQPSPQSLAPPAPEASPTRIALRLRRQVDYAFVGLPTPNTAQLFLLDPQGRRNVPVPPEVAAGLERALAHAAHLRTGTRVHIFQVTNRQEN